MGEGTKHGHWRHGPRQAIGGLGRFVCVRPFVLAAVLLATLPLAPAAAFDLFGWKPFGEPQKAAEPVPDPVSYEPTFNAAGEPTLGAALREQSILIAKVGEPPSGAAGLLARARTDAAALTAALYEQGHFGGRVDVRVGGRPLDAIGPFDPLPAVPVPVSIAIEPGERFAFGRLVFDQAPQGVRAPEGLATGAPASTGPIVLMADRMIAAWREAGHPLAKVTTREVIADHKTGTLDVRLVVTPGPKAALGAVRVAGAKEVDAGLIEARSGLVRGAPYHPSDLRRAERRLRDLDVFGSVRVREGDALDPDGTLPIVIEVDERLPRVIGASLTYSNTDGVALEAYWLHRNLFGGGEQIRFSGSVSRLGDAALTEPDFRLAMSFRKPAVITPMTDFTFDAEALRETTEAYRREAVVVSAGLVHRFSDEITLGGAIEAERSQVRDDFRVSDHFLAGMRLTFEWDNRDNRLDPSEGFRVLFAARPTYDLLRHNTFAGFRVDASAYQALDEARRFVIAGRVALATVTVDDVFALPADRRLYAGGGGSVRGYAFRNIGPRAANGDLIGGRSLVEGSLELRYRINETFGLAAFVDAGGAFDQMWPDFGGMKVGVGVGIRYLTPIGPLRLDVALPLDPGQDDPRFAVYVGLGQSF